MSERSKRETIRRAQRLIAQHWEGLGYEERRECEAIRDEAIEFLKRGSHEQQVVRQ